MKWLKKPQFRILEVHYSNDTIKYFIQYRCCGLFWLKIHYGEFLLHGLEDDRYTTSWGNIPIYEFDNLEDAKLALQWKLKDKRCMLGVNLSKEIIYLFEDSSNEILPPKYYGSTDYNKANYLFEKHNYSIKSPKIIKKNYFYSH